MAKISRRNFLIATGATGAALLLGGYGLAELSDPDRGALDRLRGVPLTQLPQIEGAWTLQENNLMVDLAKLPELDELGGAVRIEGDVLAQPVLVFKGEDDKYRAIENVCPHAGRKIDPIVGTMTLECCSISSSIFDYEGNVLSGPAEATLTFYDISVVEEQMFITLQ